MYDSVLFFNYIIDNKIVTKLICLLLYFDVHNKYYDIYMYVNSLGGDVFYSFTFIDIILYVDNNMNTMNVGISISIFSYIMSNGIYGKRFTIPNATFILYTVKHNTKGQATEIFMETHEINRLRRIVRYLYSECTRQSLNHIVTDIIIMIIINTKMACEYGIIDYIFINLLF